ncbi:MAG TPA: hypothetical protein K8W22_13355 [Gordonibacter urolithinfaciens]|uniref:hypothetical protein n=1 Tax=Gordonibacter urolithinfaciens TaxID=1335613 RepID=UPI001D95218D|nr:hypothetical protein [Gordonibacter urolithinfaciens]HJF64434.1 hypothetical protein [Gordonibacter urolithinfaciens]
MLSTMSAGASGVSAAAFSLAKERGVGHSSPTISSKQSAQAALISSAALHVVLLCVCGFVIAKPFV